MNTGKSSARGFTLIEMMISLAIGTLLTFTALTLYSQMSRSSSIVRTDSLLLENAYFIQQTLRQYINQAGYRPDDSTTSALLMPINTTEQAFPEVSGEWASGQYIRSVDDGFAIRFKGASASDGTADGSVINCQRTAIGESDVVSLTIKVSDGTLLCDSADEELVLIDENDGLNIEELALYFGVDTNNDGSTDEYIEASTATDETILSVRLSFLLGSLTNVLTNSTDYTFDGVAYTPSDRKLRHETSLWVELKN